MNFSFKGWALVKLTGREEDVTCAPGLSGLTILQKVFLIKQFSSNSFTLLWKPVAPLLNYVYETPDEATITQLQQKYM